MDRTEKQNKKNPWFLTDKIYLQYCCLRASYKTAERTEILCFFYIVAIQIKPVFFNRIQVGPILEKHLCIRKDSQAT